MLNIANHVSYFTKDYSLFPFVIDNIVKNWSCINSTSSVSLSSLPLKCDYTSYNEISLAGWEPLLKAQMTWLLVRHQLCSAVV